MLIKCIDCGRAISDSALSCWHCGGRVPSPGNGEVWRRVLRKASEGTYARACRYESHGTVVAVVGAFVGVLVLLVSGEPLSLPTALAAALFMLPGCLVFAYGRVLRWR